MFGSNVLYPGVHQLPHFFLVNCLTCFPVASSRKWCRPNALELNLYQSIHAAHHSTMLDQGMTLSNNTCIPRLIQHRALQPNLGGNHSTNQGLKLLKTPVPPLQHTQPVFDSIVASCDRGQRRCSARYHLYPATVVIVLVFSFPRSPLVPPSSTVPLPKITLTYAVSHHLR